MPQLTIEELHNYWIEHNPNETYDTLIWEIALNGDELRADILMKVMEQEENKSKHLKSWWD